MPPTIEALAQVPESHLIETIKLFSDDGADIVTAVNDKKGTFTVEAIFSDNTPGGPTSVITLDGKMSTFGGPNDTGVTPSEGLSLFEPEDVAANPDLFVPAQPPGTTGLARRLNPDAKYLACRWDLSATPRSFLRTLKTVKVTNPANGQSVNARPADTGPAVFTGRVTDLSPGLAAALGLHTDNECRVEIPTPAGAQFPPPGTGVANNVNIAAIDASIFPADMTRKLVVMTTSNKATFWVTNQIGPEEGGQSLLRRVGTATAAILQSDTTVFPVKATDQIPAAVADELNKAVPELMSSGGPGGNPPQPGDDINAKVFVTAKNFVGHVTSDVPGTDGGNLACAWAVNQVTRLALGKPISSDGGKNGLSTIGIFDALKAHHTKLNSASDAVAGTIIISPTKGNNHGHVGVVGENKQVFSNKSVPGVFAQNFTVQSFTNRYVGKGLEVLFFALNRNQF